jgi:hypothetical protein
MYGCLHVHDLHEVGAVDDSIEPAAVDAQVIAHVPELEGHSRIALCEYVAGVDPCGIVEIVESGLVAAHIALVEQEEALDLPRLRAAGDLIARRGGDGLNPPAGGYDRAGQTYGQQSEKSICSIYSHRMKLTLIMKLVPGIG